MACFAFLKKFCNRLNAYISNFWWKGNPEDRGIHWTSWDNLTVAKIHGGMGFRDFKAFNTALLARQAWRLIKYPNSYCAQILKGVYYPSSDMRSAVNGRKASWAWVSLLQGRDLLLKGLR